MVSFILMDQRIQKILSAAGIASRRKAEELIVDGRVTVNGQTVSLGAKADPDNDYIKLDGKLVAGPWQKTTQAVYLMFHKPRGVMTTLSDPEGRPTVKDYLAGVRQRVYPVGRLDYHSEGLLLLTSDGDFAHAMLHPSKKIAKTYLVKVKGSIAADALALLRRGVRMEDGLTMPAKVKKIRESENNSWIEITIYEGKKRQVRRMLEIVGHPVLKLKRIAIDGLKLGNLKPGEVRPLTREDLAMLRKEVLTD